MDRLKLGDKVKTIWGGIGRVWALSGTDKTCLILFSAGVVSEWTPWDEVFLFRL